jgi:hypothetical protein
MSLCKIEKPYYFSSCDYCNFGLCEICYTNYNMTGIYKVHILFYLIYILILYIETFN